jgi:MerR family transcriptional regulator, repressor of the yfmOP operon
MSATSDRTLRIGEVADLTGTTPRTIRYYEEIGLLASTGERELGKHRCYTQADVERVREIVRLKGLLGLSLEQLSQLLAAEDARAEIRREYRQSEDPAHQRRLLNEALGHIGNQLELVRGRRRELEELEGELVDKRRTVQKRLGELSQ